MSIVDLTLRLHKPVYLFTWGKNNRVDITATMLDTRYWILDIRECAESEIQQHPASSLPGRSSERAKTGNQYPGSRYIDYDFHYNG
jgi:hypothetical protein